MSNHMQDPWPPFIDICEPATPHPDSDGVVRLDFNDYRRAKACVNALAGVTTEWLEKFSVDGSENVAQENVRLTKQRDELLEALEAAVECGIVPLSSAKEGGAAKYSRQVAVADKIRDAIAKAKGGAA